MKFGVLILSLSPKECLQLFEWDNVDIIQISLENQLEKLTAETIGLLTDKCKESGKRLAYHAPSADIFLGSRNIGIRKESINQIKKTIRLVGSHSEFITIHTGFTPRFANQNDFERCLSALKFLAKTAENYNTYLAIENVHEETIDQILNYCCLTNISSLRLTLDVAHLLLYSNISLDVALKVLSSKLIDIHLSRPDKDRDMHLPFNNNWNVLKEIMDITISEGYRGFITIEALNINDAKKSMKTINQYKIDI